MRPSRLIAVIALSFGFSASALELGAGRVGATSQVDVVGPPGSEEFGTDVTVLDNGNFVVVDPSWDSPTHTDVGAVRLYDGRDLSLISTLTGLQDADRIGGDGITVLPGTSNFVVQSTNFNNGALARAGAATFIDGTVGLDGEVSNYNSITGLSNDDHVGTSIVPLEGNGKYVVISPLWNGGAADVGAATLAAADGSTVGYVLATNSLVGGFANDGEGMYVTALTNGNYVVAHPSWQANDLGAVTWASGASATPVGAIGAGKSLRGVTLGDNIGATTRGVVPLTNGNYLVVSSEWTNAGNNDAGAVTWATGVATTNATVTTLNSIVGVDADDGDDIGAVALTNGHYVVNAASFDGPGTDRGAAAWGNGDNGAVHGAISSANSIVGDSDGDEVGEFGAYPLSNGNYVVASPSWRNDDGDTSAGAATWGNGSTSGPRTIGVVSPGNSLVGSTPGDGVGTAIEPLDVSGNYVVVSQDWDNGGSTDAGAATWGNGSGGTVGPVTPANSLVGTHADDSVASNVRELTNGNYVVTTPTWDNGSVQDAGAVTWVAGATGSPRGPVDPANSLVGTHASDGVGLNSFSAGVLALANGNYVVPSAGWSNGTLENVGAATWGNGNGGTTGPVTEANSLHGTQTNDRVAAILRVLDNGDYLVASRDWHNGSIEQAGAVTWGSGSGGTVGPVTAANSLVGTHPNDRVGLQVTTLPGSTYVVVVNNFDNGPIVDAGAVAWGGATPGGLTGPLTNLNALIGTAPNDVSQVPGATIANGSILVQRPNLSRVTAFSRDLTPPVFGAHPDVHVVAAAGQSSAFVNYTLPIATEDVGTAPVLCLPPPGSSFPVGDTPVTCSATNPDGVTAFVTFTVSVTNGSDYIALAPARLADSRPGGQTADGQFAAGGQIAADGVLALAVAGRGGVPADAVAATLNVTVTEAAAPGFATVYPCGEPRPTASNLNYTAGSTVPNAVLAKIGANGNVCIYSQNATHLVVDVNGAFPPSTSYEALNPARVLDTRQQPTVDGQSSGAGIAAAGSVTTVKIAGRAGVPNDAGAVALNVTVTEPSVAGYASVYPCGTEPPTASSLNYTPGLTVPNAVLTKIGADGSVCIYTQNAAHLIADVNGYFPAATTFGALVPARLYDSRLGATTIDGQGAGAGLRPLGSTTTVHVTGRGGVPGTASTVVLNVTVTEAAAPGFVTVFPCGIDAPLASNLNFVGEQTVPNAVLAKIGTNGDVCVFTSQAAHLVVDVTGLFP